MKIKALMAISLLLSIFGYIMMSYMLKMKTVYMLVSISRNNEEIIEDSEKLKNQNNFIAGASLVPLSFLLTLKPTPPNYPTINYLPVTSSLSLRTATSFPPPPPEVPLLTIFTTFKEGSIHHRLAHRLVILNWASFGTVYIKPVLFTSLSLEYLRKAVKGVDAKKSFHENRTLAEHALLNGWDVLPIHSLNKYGTPHLKPMYEEIFNRYNSTFYGFSNGDLLFDDSMLETLFLVKKFLEHPLQNNVLLIGRRRDIPLYSKYFPKRITKTMKVATTTNDPKIPALAPEIPEETMKRFNKSNLSSMTKTGILACICAIDFFFFTRENCTFNWTDLADVVIGRVAYDQYIVAKSIDYRVNSIDLTGTMTTIHLSKPGVHETGRYNTDSGFNNIVIGHNFPYSKGVTSKSTYYTSWNNTLNSSCLVNRKSHEIFL